MPQCLKCGAELPVNEEGMAPVLCDRCAGRATSRARRGMNTGTMRDYPVTTALVAINIAVFLWMVVNGGSLMEFNGRDLIRAGGNFGPLTLGGEYWRLVTTGFVHGGLLHIGFNMWCLWSLGQLSERLFGRWITAAVYVLTGVGGSMLSIWWNPDRLEIGASGAIFGIAGAILSGIKFGNVSISSIQKRQIFSSLIFFIIFNFAIGLSPGIDNMCHLGGFASGLIFGVPLAVAASSGRKSYEWLTILLASLVLAGVGAQLVTAKGHESRLKVASLDIHDGNYPAAIRVLEQDIASNPNDAQAQGMLGLAYDLNRDRDKAISAYQRALQLDPNFPEVKENLEKLQSTSK